MTNALIFAGGYGSRMNSRSKPKQFLQLYGKEIIVHTVENFQNHPLVDGIVIVCKEDWIDFAKNLVQKYALTKVSSIIPGGETGQESIFYGLRALSEHCDEKSIVLVHDGVRPFVSFELISSCVDSVKHFGSAVTAVPATESIVTACDGVIQDVIDRDKSYIAKAPQCFYLGELLQAHLKARADNLVTAKDSAALMSHYGHKLHTVEGTFDNIKITTPEDFYIFRALYDAHENQQIFGI